MENITESTVQDLFQVHENNFCFECGSNHNQWASLNNGILLCSRCASIHKGFGSDISLIKSLNQDTWSSAELEIMKKGGNDNLQECFEKYNVSMKGPLEFKYKTRASYYYREKLRALNEGTTLPVPPSIDEGAEFLDPKNVPALRVRRKSRNMSFSRQLTSSSCEPRKENKLEEADTSTNTDANTEADANENPTTNKKVKAEKLKTEMKEGLQSFRQSIAKFSEKMKESKKRKQETKAQQENIPPNIQEVPVPVPESVKKSGLKSKGILSGGFEGAKKSYRGAVGFIKRLATKKKNQKSDFEQVCNSQNTEDRVFTEGCADGDYLDL